MGVGRNWIWGTQAPKSQETPWTGEGLGLTQETLVPKPEPTSLRLAHRTWEDWGPQWLG